MAKNHRSWVSFANRPERECDITAKDLIFVTGCDRTSDWAMLAFHSNSQQMEIEFSAGVPTVVSASAAAWGGWMSTGSVHRNCGPYREGPHVCRHLSADGAPLSEVAGIEDASDFNQTLFVRGWHIGYRLSIFPEVIRAGAGYDELGSGDRERDDDVGVLGGNLHDVTEVDIVDLSGHAPVSDLLDAGI